MIIARAKLCAVVKKKKKSIFIHFSGIESEAIEWKIVCTIRLMQQTVWQTILWKIHVWCGASHSHISVSDTLLPLLRHVFIRRIWWRRRREEKLRHFSFTKLQAIWHSSRILKSFSLHFLRRCESQMPNMEANGWNRRKNANVEIVYSSDINIWFSIVLLARFTFILNIFMTFRIWLRKLHT